MTHFARIDGNGHVEEIIALPDGTEPTEAFHAAIAAAMIECDADSVSPGMIWDGAAFAAAPVATLSPDALKAVAAAKRRAVIASGCVVDVGGVPTPVWADMAALTGAVVTAQVVGSSWTTAWKGCDGAFYPQTAATVVVLALGVAAFVSAAFAVEGALVAAIDDGTITDEAAIEDPTIANLSAWPPSWDGGQP